MKKCLDTYALVEIAKGNPRFTVYFSQEFVITEITLVEFFAVVLREDGEKTATYWYKRLEPYCLSVERSTLVEAVKFRHEHRKKKLSFFDAVGYTYALRHDCLFVTGDKEFKDFAKVEFVT